MTAGERHFIRFCSKYKFNYCPIPEDPNSETPDYELFPGTMPIIVEIKDLTHNKDELQAIKNVTRKGIAVWGSSRIGNRIRKKIKRAHGQLNKGSSPTILLIFDDRNELVSILSDYEIAVGMYGYETRVLNNDHSVSRHFGSNAQMTSNSRQYISAVGILNANLTIKLYLNWYTTRPLPSGPLTKCPAVTVFKLLHEPRKNFNDWIEVRDIND